MVELVQVQVTAVGQQQGRAREAEVLRARMVQAQDSAARQVVPRSLVAGRRSSSATGKLLPVSLWAWDSLSITA